MAHVDIFVGNETIIDQDVYQLWINGYSTHEAAQILQKRGVLQQYNATFDMLLSDTLDHYRNFSLLERFLKNPPMLGEQLVLQVCPQTQDMLIQKYYEFDSSVIRELLGKKLTSRQRSSLDDISEKTRVPLRSCRRQTVEEMMGSLVENIKSHFLLSDKLARQYAAIVFITNNRFETGKKSLGYLTFPDFVVCANHMITRWSYSSKDCKTHDDMDQDLDRDFLMELREFKTLTEKDHLELHRLQVIRQIHNKLTPSAAQDLDSNFKSFSKNIVNIAYGLNHSRELRDLFQDLVEKLVEPWKQNRWSAADIRLFLEVYMDTTAQLDFFRNRSQRLKAWDRYMGTVKSCLIQMYH